MYSIMQKSKCVPGDGRTKIEIYEQNVEKEKGKKREA